MSWIRNTGSGKKFKTKITHILCYSDLPTIFFWTHINEFGNGIKFCVFWYPIWYLGEFFICHICTFCKFLYANGTFSNILQNVKLSFFNINLSLNPIMFWKLKTLGVHECEWQVPEEWQNIFLYIFWSFCFFVWNRTWNALLHGGPLRYPHRVERFEPGTYLTAGAN